jgi:hypothetical protein
MSFVGFSAAGGSHAAHDAGIGDAGAANARAWSDPAAWGGRVPAPDDDVVVGPGRTIVVDGDVCVRSITVFGTLLFAPRDLTLRTRWILVDGGTLRAGSAESPHEARLTIGLAGSASDRDVRGLGTKFLAAVRGGTIGLHGRLFRSWVPLGASTAAGCNAIRVAQPVDWPRGAAIAIASGGTELPLVEERRIDAVGRDRLTLMLDRPLQHRHAGVESPLRAPASTLGKVALLDRSIVVAGDDASAERGFGAHCLIGSRLPDAGDDGARASIGRFRGVEFRRVGQFNRRDRFPLHWCDNGDSTASCVIDCVIRESFQRGVVITGSPHVRIAGNVVYKSFGHAYVIEGAADAAQITGSNLAVRPRVVRFVDPGLRSLHEHHPRAFWFGPQRAPAPPTVRRAR